MLFITGTLLSAFCVIYFCIVLLAARNPVKQGWWTKPMMIESVHLFLIMGSAVMGPVLMIKGVSAHLDSTQGIAMDAIVFACILVVTIFIVRKMNIKARLSEFAALEARLEAKKDRNIRPNNDPDMTPIHKAA